MASDYHEITLKNISIYHYKNKKRKKRNIKMKDKRKRTYGWFIGQTEKHKLTVGERESYI